MLSETYTKDDLPAIWNEFNARVLRLQHAVDTNTFPPKPSGLCKAYRKGVVLGGAPALQ